MTDRPPFFAFYPADFANDINVESMSTLQVGAYLLLLCKAWQAEPPASLPNDDQTLARLARVAPEVWREIGRGVLGAFRLGSDGRLHNKRLRQEYDIAKRKMKAFRDAGKKGGKTRAENLKAKGVTQKQPSQACLSLEATSKHLATSQSQSEINTKKEEPPQPPAKPGGEAVPELTKAIEDKPPLKAGKVSHPMAESVPIPAVLDTPPFRAVWSEWLGARRDKKNPITARAAKMQFKTLVGIGLIRAVAALENSIANGYTGVFEPSKGSVVTTTFAPPDQREQLLKMYRSQRDTGTISDEEFDERTRGLS